MSKIVVLGGGVCGLAAGILLRRDGHDVTVLERDPDPVPGSPEEAWERWARDGVSQFRLAHYMTPKGRIVLQEALPDVLDGVEAAGGATFDPLPLMPPSIVDRAPREGDDRFRTVTSWPSRRSRIPAASPHTPPPSTTILDMAPHPSLGRKSISSRLTSSGASSCIQ